MAGVALQGKDLKFTQMLIHHQVLEKVDHHKLDLKTGVILVCCGDGDHSEDIFQHQVGLFRRMGDPQVNGQEPIKPRIHLVTLNGGPLVLVKDSPIQFGLPQDEVSFLSVAGAILLGKGTTVALMPHTCGAAMKILGMSMEQIFDDLCQAHDRMKQEIVGRVQRLKQALTPQFDHVEVTKVCTIPYIHLDLGNGVKKTYYFNQIRYQEVKARMPEIEHEYNLYLAQQAPHASAATADQAAQASASA